MIAPDREPTTHLGFLVFLAFFVLAGYFLRFAVENFSAWKALKRDPTLPKQGRLDWTAEGLHHILTYDAASGRAIDHTTVLTHPSGIRVISQYDFKYKGMLRVTKDNDGTVIQKEIWIPCLDCPWSAGHWSKINDDLTYDRGDE